jgi:hypothetical protein
VHIVAAIGAAPGALLACRLAAVTNCCAVLCCAVLCSAVLCCAVLWRAAQGAVAAGMKVVAVPSMVGSQDEEFQIRVSDDGEAASSPGRE